MKEISSLHSMGFWFSSFPWINAMFRLSIQGNATFLGKTTITLHGGKLKRTDANLHTRNQTELENNPSVCPWKQEDLGIFPGCCCKAALIYSDTKDQGCWGRCDLEIQCLVRIWMLPYKWISIPVNGYWIMLPNGTLLHFQMFSHRVIEILATVRREDSRGNLQFAGTKGGR